MIVEITPTTERRVFRVQCMMCGRSPGHCVDGRFKRDPRARAPAMRDGRRCCGDCGGSLILELDQHASGTFAALSDYQPPGTYVERIPVPPPAEAEDRDGRVVRLGLREIRELPEHRNSRIRNKEASLDELASSIRQHGLLQPLLVRPIAQHEYEVIVGNRRLKAARRAGLSEVDCVIRITDADGAFVLNVVANVQRRELSGRERARAIMLLASLADEHGLPLGVRAISRRTGLSPATISTWLHINRRPALRAALEEERLDIGRTMKLVRAPTEALPELIDKARTMSQAELVAAVARLNRQPRLRERNAAENERRALLVVQALDQIDEVHDSVRIALERAHKRLHELLGQLSSCTVA